jgi:hypothetical protein
MHYLIPGKAEEMDNTIFLIYMRKLKLIGCDILLQISVIQSDQQNDAGP